MPRVSPRCSLYLLGSFRLERDSKTIHLPTRKAESLLAYLTLFPQFHPREKLAALLWGNTTDAQARASLRNALAALRKYLGDEIFLTDHQQIRINPRYALSVDALQFIENAERIIHSGDMPARLDSQDWQSTIDLYQDDLLTDLYDDWVLTERERFRAQFVRLLLHLAQQARAGSEYDDAIALARQILRVDPGNEKAYQHLMFCYHAKGDRTAALKQYAECQRALKTELNAEPVAETTALCEWIKQSSAQSSRAALPTNLPMPLTSFVGREKEMTEIKRLFATARILTLAGVGGVGKTRLAIRVASDMLEALPDGVWLVELAELMDPARVPQAVAQTLGLPQISEKPQPLIAQAIGARRMLLVLDNCEHLVDACAHLAETLVRGCPNLHLLVTSREVLGISGEIVWNVSTLPAPDTMELPADWHALTEFASVRLFLDRASAASPSFKMTGQNAAVIARICQRLDGIPLAIELASARLKTVEVEWIADRLDDRFRLLTGGSQIALPRYHALRATIDWSYDLLSDEERALFRHLSVFVGGWTLQAAEKICADARTTTLGAYHVLNLMTRLVDKSLVLVEETGAERYRLLETIREYGRAKLLETAEAAEVRGRHRDWYLELAEQAETKLRGPEQAKWLERLEREQGNMRAALEWSLEEGSDAKGGMEKGLRLAGALAQFWMMRGSFIEGRRWLERVLQQSQAREEFMPAHAKALAGAGVLALLQRDLPRARELGEASLEFARQIGDNWLISISLYVIVQCRQQLDEDLDETQQLVDEQIGLARRLGDKYLLAVGLFNAGTQMRLRGMHDQALELLEESCALSRGLGDQWIYAAAVDLLGEIHYVRAQYVRAHVLFEEGLGLRRQLNDPNSIAGSLNNMGNAARMQGDCAQAAKLYEESIALLSKVGQTKSVAVVQRNQGWALSGMGDCACAAESFKSSLALFQELGDREGIATCIAGLASVAAQEGKRECAARLFGTVEAMRESVGTPVAHPDFGNYAAELESARTDWGEDVINRAIEKARAMALEKAIGAALER